MQSVDLNKLRKEQLIKEVSGLSKSLCEKLSGKCTMLSRAEKNKLLVMYHNCFMNTAETTVEYIGEDEVFVITGDIHAMWLRDSSAQVAHYLPFVKENPELARMVKALVKRQFHYIGIDPYANAFNKEPNGNCWAHDNTDTNPWNWERKYELDSLCYPVRLLYDYWKYTSDSTIFTEHIHKTLQDIVSLWRTEQYHDLQSPYYFQRENCPPSDTLPNGGKGLPTAYTGLIWSGFRPSDDACLYGYLIPSNMFAAVVLSYIEEIAETVYKDRKLLSEAAHLKRNVKKGLKQYAIVQDESFGRIYAYETDGYGNYNLMDDANVPSLLSLPWLRYCTVKSKLYQNTRSFILSSKNKYYYEGAAAKGIGSPHTPEQYIWHIALCMQGLTARTKKEKIQMLRQLINTDGGTGFMHEGFHCDNPMEYTRDWFAWANSLFALFVTELFEL